MGEFKGFMKYEKQSLAELSLIERLEGHEAFQQRFSREEASIQGQDVWIVERHFVKLDFLSTRNNWLSNRKLYTRME